MRKEQELSPLMNAADSVDRELRHFAELADSIQRQPLGSQKQLDRAAQLLTQVAESDERLGKALSALVAAIGTARDQQVQQAQAISERAKELEARNAVFRELVQRYEQLGNVASQVTAAMQAIAAGPVTEKPGEVSAALPELIASVGRAGDAAKDLVGAANEKGFADLSRSAESLRQQILSAQNKMTLLHKRLGAANN